MALLPSVYVRGKTVGFAQAVVYMDAGYSIFALESLGSDPSVHQGESKQSAVHVGTESCEAVRSKEADARKSKRDLTPNAVSGQKEAIAQCHLSKPHSIWGMHGLKQIRVGAEETRRKRRRRGGEGQANGENIKDMPWSYTHNTL